MGPRGIVKYPSRAAFVEMQTRPDFQARHVHKDAGMEQTIVLAGEPMHLPQFPELPPFELPAGDQPFVMMHVMKFGEAGRDALTGYSASAGAAGLALGVRPGAFFRVEGTVVGDGRTWDEVRFNRFPSHAVFDALRANETHRSGQQTRTAALQDTYTMMLLPIIDRLSESTRVELERPHQ